MHGQSSQSCAGTVSEPGSFNETEVALASPRALRHDQHNARTTESSLRGLHFWGNVTGKFADVDWYCDECEDPLNDQLGFDDDCGTWACTECGHPNDISSDAIIPESVVERALDYLSKFDPKNFRG